EEKERGGGAGGGGRGGGGGPGAGGGRLWGGGGGGPPRLCQARLNLPCRLRVGTAVAQEDIEGLTDSHNLLARLVDRPSRLQFRRDTTSPRGRAPLCFVRLMRDLAVKPRGSRTGPSASD